MPNTVTNIYWDANVFLSYVNNEEDKMPTLEELLESNSGSSRTIKLYTSSLSQVEVAFAASERRQQRLSPEVEEQISALWEDSESVVSVEYQEMIGGVAKDLIRDAITKGWSLKPLDAIHLASAQWLLDVGVTVDEFHTYDAGLFKYNDIVDCPIVRPHTPQPRMF